MGGFIQIILQGIIMITLTTAEWEEIVQQAVDLPKGVEPHRWSDYQFHKKYSFTSCKDCIKYPGSQFVGKSQACSGCKHSYGDHFERS